MVNYKIELKVLSAVHIGQGSNYDISKYDYIKIPNQNKIIIIDERKLFSILSKKGFEEKYFEFVGNARGEKSNLYNFLKNELKLNENEYQKIVNEIKKYELEFKEDKFYPIKTFVKDKKSGKAYIPSSSLKGIISTAFLCKLKIDNNDNPDALKKIMSKISISDSSLIDFKNIFVSKVFYASPNKKIPKSLNQYYEMLKPGTKTSFILSIKDSYDEKNTIEDIKKYLRVCNSRYEKYYSESFKDTVKIMKNEENTIKSYLGAKTGFPTKTFYYQVYPDAPKRVAEILDKYFSKLRGKHINVKGKSPSCIKCVNIMNEYVENGAIQLKITELDNK